MGKIHPFSQKMFPGNEKMNKKLIWKKKKKKRILTTPHSKKFKKKITNQRNFRDRTFLQIAISPECKTQSRTPRQSAQLKPHIHYLHPNPTFCDRRTSLCEFLSEERRERERKRRNELKRREEERKKRKRKRGKGKKELYFHEKSSIPKQVLFDSGSVFLDPFHCILVKNFLY